MSEKVKIKLIIASGQTQLSPEGPFLPSISTNLHFYKNGLRATKQVFFTVQLYSNQSWRQKLYDVYVTSMCLRKTIR